MALVWTRVIILVCLFGFAVNQAPAQENSQQYTPLPKSVYDPQFRSILAGFILRVGLWANRINLQEIEPIVLPQDRMYRLMECFERLKAIMLKEAQILENEFQQTPYSSTSPGKEIYEQAREAAMSARNGYFAMSIVPILLTNPSGAVDHPYWNIIVANSNQMDLVESIFGDLRSMSAATQKKVLEWLIQTQCGY